MAKKQKSKSLLITIVTIIVLLLVYYFEKPINKGSKENQKNTEDFSNLSFSSDNDTTRLIVMFYNMENFFDTLDDAKNRYDDEYTPNGKKHWNTKRYMRKIQHIAKVFISVDSAELPDLIGVCEVENRQVLQDLIDHSPLKGYQIVHYDSKDMRGIDLALLYDPTEFKVLNSEKIPIHYKPGKIARTREIIHIIGYTRNGETLHIFLNHWKSRLSRGNNDSEYKRIAAAKDLKKAVAKVLKQNPDAKIIIMGDFNDEPTNKSIYQALGAKEKPQRYNSLYNLMLPLDKQDKGTYFYNHHWLMFDNIILSGNFVIGNSKLIPEGDGKILYKDFLLDSNKKGERYPFRTFKGSKYLGGYSDHLPVYEIFDVKY